MQQGAAATALAQRVVCHAAGLVSCRHASALHTRADTRNATRVGVYPLVVPVTEAEGMDRKSLELPGSQLDVIQVLYGACVGLMCRQGWQH